MKFYFCETCGKRLTEKDINEGAARNKKLKGVFCTECAVGVTTMDTIPMSDREAREVVEKAGESDKAIKPGRRRTSAARIQKPSDRRKSDRLRQSDRSLPAARPGGPNPLLFVGGGAGLAALCVIGFLVFGSSKPTPKKRTKKTTKKTAKEDKTDTRVATKVTETPPDNSTKTQPDPTTTKTTDTTTPAVPTVDYAARWDTAKKAAEAALTEGDLKKAWDGASAFSREVSSSPKAASFKAGIDELQKKITDAAAGQMKRIREEVKDNFNQERQQLTALKASLPAELAQKAELDKALADVDAREKAFKQAASAKVAQQQALLKAESKFRDYFDAFNQSVMKQDYAEAGSVAKKAKADKELGDFTKAATALEPVNKALMMRGEVEQEKLKALVGKEHSFLTKKKVMTGKVNKIVGDVIKISVKGKINNQTIEYGREVKLSDLTPKGILKIFGPFEPDNPDAWVAKAVRLMAMKDLDGTAKALAQAKDHPLAPQYLEWVKDEQMGAAEGAAKRFWEKRIVPMMKLANMNKKAAETVEQQLQTFFAEHGKTEHAKKVKKRADALLTSLKVAKATEVIDVGEGLQLHVVNVPAGSFTIGSPPKEERRAPNELQHEVVISKGFRISKYEITQALFLSLMGSNPSKFKGPSNPVDQVTWDEAQAFCQKLAAKIGKKVRLPTEAEWEYVCRAKSTTAYYPGDADEDLGDFAWNRTNSEWKTHPVGQKFPNGYGVCDIHGNVWEWCSDWYGEYPPKAGKNAVKGPLKDYKGAGRGSFRVLRGGAFRSAPWICRSAYRYAQVPTFRHPMIGFRVVVE